MEITATPSRGRGRHVLLRLLVALGVLVLVALLAPVVFGLSGHVVTDGAMGSSLPRGSVVYGEAVPLGELAEDDVIIFRRPSDTGDGAWVVRRIVTIRDDVIVTRGDARRRVDPWQLAAEFDASRLSFYVPLVGYAWLAVGPLAWGTAALLLVGAVVAVSRRRTSGEPGPGIGSGTAETTATSG